MEFSICWLTPPQTYGKSATFFYTIKMIFRQFLPVHNLQNFHLWILVTTCYFYSYQMSKNVLQTMQTEENKERLELHITE